MPIFQGEQKGTKSTGVGCTNGILNELYPACEGKECCYGSTRSGEIEEARGDWCLEWAQDLSSRSRENSQLCELQGPLTKNCSVVEVVKSE